MFGYRHGDLNRFNRPVRTRMPGGVAGDRSAILAAPIPIELNFSSIKKAASPSRGVAFRLNRQHVKLPARTVSRWSHWTLLVLLHRVASKLPAHCRCPGLRATEIATDVRNGRTHASRGNFVGEPCHLANRQAIPSSTYAKAIPDNRSTRAAVVPSKAPSRTVTRSSRWASRRTVARLPGPFAGRQAVTRRRR